MERVHSRPGIPLRSYPLRGENKFISSNPTRLTWNYKMLMTLRRDLSFVHGTMKDS
jgi:hypothetical protein